jgi:hypothetical protein
MLPSSVGRGTAQAGGSSGPVPEYSPGASNPNSGFVPPPETPEAPKKSNLPGQGGNPPSKSKGPDWMTGRGSPDYSVKKNPFPFQPDIPGSGGHHNRAYYQMQEDLLKTMLPYWNK